MKKKMIIIILSIIILIGGILGVSLYLGLRDTRTELAISFYDDKVELSLGKYDYKINVRKGNPMESGDYYYFESEEESRACFKEIKKSEYLILDKGDYAVYNKDGYYYFSKISISTQSSIIILQNFFTCCVHYGFYPFFLVQDGYYIQNLLNYIKYNDDIIGYTCTISWESLTENGGLSESYKIQDNPLGIFSKEDVLSFYNKVNKEYWRYDEQKDVLYVKYYKAIGSSFADGDRLSKNYTMEIRFSEEGLTLNIYLDSYFEQD